MKSSKEISRIEIPPQEARESALTCRKKFLCDRKNEMLDFSKNSPLLLVVSQYYDIQ